LKGSHGRISENSLIFAYCTEQGEVRHASAASDLEGVSLLTDPFFLIKPDALKRGADSQGGSGRKRGLACLPQVFDPKPACDGKIGYAGESQSREGIHLPLIQKITLSV